MNTTVVSYRVMRWSYTVEAKFVSRSSQDNPNNLFVRSRQAGRDVLEKVWQLHQTDFLLAVSHYRLRLVQQLLRSIL